MKGKTIKAGRLKSGNVYTWFDGRVVVVLTEPIRKPLRDGKYYMEYEAFYTTHDGKGSVGTARPLEFDLFLVL